MPRALLAAVPLIATLLLAAACGDSGGAESSDVRPFADIQASDVEFEFDGSATVGRLLVDTDIEVVCAVAYGETETLGLIATDDDMAGGAHADHSPRLPGLQPDTEYFFRLQGVDAAGTLYQSELMTFRTPEAVEAAGPGVNVAPSGVVTASSSEFSAGFAAANAFDGDFGTEWSSAGDGDDAFIEVDLGAPTDVVAVWYHTRQMTDGTAIAETYTITVDGGDPLGPFPVDGSPTEVALTGQVLRFEVASSTGGNTGAVEIEVFTGS